MVPPFHSHVLQAHVELAPVTNQAEASVLREAESWGLCSSSEPAGPLVLGGRQKESLGGTGASRPLHWGMGELDQGYGGGAAQEGEQARAGGQALRDIGEGEEDEQARLLCTNTQSSQSPASLPLDGSRSAQIPSTPSGEPGGHIDHTPLQDQGLWQVGAPCAPCLLGWAIWMLESG